MRDKKKKTKTIKVQDLKPKKDAKGGVQAVPLVRSRGPVLFIYPFRNFSTNNRINQKGGGSPYHPSPQKGWLPKLIA